MTQIKTKIPAELEPAAVGGMVTDSKYVKDRVKNKTQKEINADTEERVSTLEESVGTGGSVDERIATAKSEVIDDAGTDYNTLGKLEDKLQEEVANRASQNYTKSETYSKTELNNMITTPSQEYVTVTATDQTTAVTDVLPATGEADTVYRVGNWDGSQYDTTCYTEYAWNGSVYVPLNTKEYGIDEEPIPESNNLVKSGGIYKSIKDKIDLKPYSSENINEVSISDENGNIILKVDDGRIKTTKFDSDEVIAQEYVHKDFAICDENGNAIFEIKDGNLKTKYFNSENFKTREISVDFNTEVIAPIQNNSNLVYEKYSTIGQFDFDFKWVGACLADNGRIYGIVNGNRQVIEIDPIKNTFCLFGNTSAGSFKWSGCGIYKNGLILGYPRSANSVLVIDPKTQFLEERQIGTSYGQNHHYGGCIVGDKMYLAPRNAGHILVINLLDWSTYTLAGDVLTTSNNYCSVTYHPNGYIYFIPETNAKIIKLNPADDSFELIGDILDTCSVYGAIVAPNQCIYGFTGYHFNGGVLKIDVPNNDAVSFIGEGTIGNGYYGTKLGLNGKIYSVVGSATALWELDPANDSFRQVDTINDNVGGDYNEAKCAGGVLAEDGTIYFMPAKGRHIYCLNFSGDVSQTLSRKVLSSNYFSNY